MCVVHKKNIQVYIRLTHLVVSSQRLGAVRSRKDYLIKVHRTQLSVCA